MVSTNDKPAFRLFTKKSFSSLQYESMKRSTVAISKIKKMGSTLFVKKRDRNISEEDEPSLAFTRFPSSLNEPSDNDDEMIITPITSIIDGYSTSFDEDELLENAREYSTIEPPELYYTPDMEHYFLNEPLTSEFTQFLVDIRQHLSNIDDLIDQELELSRGVVILALESYTTRRKL
ncbi:hypothetical protein BDB01DRAFT_855134 [Pilobolus umbonatus]|nr:hypothetical protein BDB01DRAFT_855134 [Pilobolus umbonatus]